MFKTLRDGPCECMCHDRKGIIHFMACCAYTGMSRTEAEVVVRTLPKEDEVLERMSKLSPHEIHDMACNGTLFEKFPLGDYGEDKSDSPAAMPLFKDIVPYRPGDDSSKKD